MSTPPAGAKGPDFAAGVPVKDIANGATLAGHSATQPILVSRFGDAYFAIGGVCTHYGAPLSDGLCRGGTVRCPWHHARFDLRSGVALEAPAFDALERWKVEIEGGTIFVRERLGAAPAAPVRSNVAPKAIVIVGGGAAGFAAAQMLRQRGFAGAVTILSAETSPPCDRPNLSKDYLAGTAPPEWMPLKSDDFYKQNEIDLRLGAEVREIDVQARVAVTTSGDKFGFDTLLLATGAEPVRLPTPGFNLPNVHVLRSMADADALIAAAKQARHVAVIGASFIALEAAAALRARGLDVHVVAPDEAPMQRVLGPEIGAYVQKLHERNGVQFHLGLTGQHFDGERLTLSDGAEIAVDLIVLGVGVRPRLALAEAAGLNIDRGVLVDEFLQTSVPRIYAAGDIARYPQAGGLVRVEHWVVAERQGQIAARNMLGEKIPYRSTAFFWSRHYDVSIRYVGHVEAWEAINIDGSLDAGDATVRYLYRGQIAAAASIGRDLDSLEIEAGMESRRELQGLF